MRILVLVSVLAACERSPSKSEPIAPPRDASADVCPPDVVPKMDQVFQLFDDYYGTVATVLGAVTETSECEAMRTQLVKIAPVAEDFASKMMSFKEWGKTVSAECKASFEVRFGDRGNAMEAKYRQRVEHGSELLLRRCGQHPGMEDAYKTAVRVLKKKKS